MTKAQGKNGADTDRLIRSLIGLPIFDTLEKGELELVVKYMDSMNVEPGEYVFREGEEGSHLCFVASGEFEVMKESSKGIVIRISTLQKGDSIGEMAVIDSYPRSAAVRAKTEGMLITLSRDDFDLLLKERPITGIKVLRAIARLLCSNLRKTSTAVVDQLLPW
jgi:CRP-like cAMP-binding protein